MTSPELLRFFHAEAREYLDAIEILVAAGDRFDAGAFVAASRALRGSATMARVPRIAEIALAMERVANGVRDEEIRWIPELREELVSSVSDLRAFVSASSRWTGEDDRRATRRLALIKGYLPVGAATPPAAPASAGSTPIFIALQASAIATDLEAFLNDPTQRDLLDDVVSRVRSLRGIAGVGDHPPLGEVADAVERALRELAPDALVREADSELLAAAAGVFRRASSDLRARGRFERASPELDRFARAAVAAEQGSDQASAPVVRIEELFFTDAGPHLVQRGAAPSRSADARFRDDVVARAEHLRRLVAEARVAMDPFSRERVRRELKSHLARMDDFARSYGAQQVASVVSEAAALDDYPDPVLDTIEAVAKVLTTPGISTDEMERRLAIRERARHETPAAPQPATSPTPRPAGAVAEAGAASRPGARSGEALRHLLGDSLSRLASLEDEPLVEPASLDDDTVVPVESLLYTGEAALQRARDVRDAMRASGSLDQDALDELYDLLDLARSG
ncbi:MAG TPA: Hpt domain-containing protein [Gemmatimonadaceae bacterium]